MVVTRFAPSPTGHLHIGGVRTALFSWLYARKFNGKFVLRIEDSDLERSNPQASNEIINSMQWLGLNYDYGPFYQTQRSQRYQTILKKLLDNNKAYYCYCTREELDLLRDIQRKSGNKPRYDRKHRNYQGPPRTGVQPVIRFKNPLEGVVVLNDMIHGKIIFQNSELDDLIIARDDGTPTYNFCVVIDDMDMGITHVIRGDDHINNTPKQINILKALDAPIPNYGHIPMILGSDGQKLSKRNGATSIMEYRELGYLPEAILNYLVRLGWSYGNKEIFSLSEMVEIFDIKNCNKSSAAINESKLIWLNKHYIKSLSSNYIANQLEWHINKNNINIEQGPCLEKLVKIFIGRSNTLRDMAESSKIFYSKLVQYNKDDITILNSKLANEVLLLAYNLFSEIKLWNSNNIKDMIRKIQLEKKLIMNDVAQPIRIAVAGQSVSPPIDSTLELIGKEKTLLRIQYCLSLLID